MIWAIKISDSVGSPFGFRKGLLQKYGAHLSNHFPFGKEAEVSQEKEAKIMTGPGEERNLTPFQSTRCVCVCAFGQRTSRVNMLFPFV